MVFTDYFHPFLDFDYTCFGLGMRLLVHKHTKLENGVLRNREQPSSAMNNLFNYGKFEAMKTLSSRTVPHNCEHQFCAKN